MTLSSLARNVGRVLDTLVTGVGLASRSIATPLPRFTLEDRLRSLPCDGLPIAAPIEIRWNDHLVPFVEAASDDDLGFAVGYVQAHLRLGHLGVTRLLATGRTAEAFGPVAAGIDAGLRMLNFGAAAAANAEALPEPTRRWIQRYCDGINHYQQTVDPLPHDVLVLDLGRRPFTIEDVLAIGRLVGNDINWLGWARLLRYRDRADWQEIWHDALHYGGAGRAAPSEAETLEEELLDELLEGVGRNGSNAIAIAGRRTPHGAAIMAGDPHVGIFLPSLWMVIGLASPGCRAVGLMIPGVPSLLVGRNQDIAWGATNMRAASSDLVDVEDLPEGQIIAREEKIRVRWGRTRKLQVRRSPFGPVVSDAPIFPQPARRKVALRWMGHGPSDEITAMLEVQRASNFAEFRLSLAKFGVSGQNFLYADRQGHIGQVMAVHLPSRDPEPPQNPILKPEACRGWNRIRTAADLPVAYDPPEGCLITANNEPFLTDLLVGYFYAANDRIVRLRQLVAGRRVWSLEALAETQRDVVRLSAVRLRDVLLAHRDDVADVEAAGLLDRLEGWNGAYEPDLFEPVLLECVATALADLLRDELGPLRGSEAIMEVLADRLETGEPAEAAALVGKAAMLAGKRSRRFRSWGQVHKLKLSHILANVPGVGRRYPRAAPPIGGSTTTVMKTAHELVTGKHGVRFGANARHLFDMSDPDASWFALLGGQDGEVGSPHGLDQLPLWLDGRYIRVPLRRETLKRDFPHLTTLRPAQSGQALST